MKGSRYGIKWRIVQGKDVDKKKGLRGRRCVKAREGNETQGKGREELK